MNKLKIKTKRINDILEKFMGLPKRSRRDADPLQILILTMLSQNTNDVNRDRAFAKLEDKYKNQDGKIDWQEIVDTPNRELKEIIRVAGLANQKSIRIQNILKWIKSEYGDYNIDFICKANPQEVIEIFTKQKGIGIKTISVVLAFSCGVDIFPVDTHVNRLCHRLGLVPEKFNAEKTFWAMQDLVPKGKSYTLHINMIQFGRKICHSRKPKCSECPLSHECDYHKKIQE